MRLFAAVDLAEGRAVQLVGGQPGSERVSRPDPVAVAREWRERGLPMLHLVDLDAALGRGENRAILTRILELPGVECQVGGGVRHAEDVLRSQGVRFLQVKTLSPRRACEHYDRTREFYLAMGYVPLEEFPLLWDERNPALQLVKAL